MAKKDKEDNIIRLPQFSGFFNVVKILALVAVFGYILFAVYSFTQKDVVNFYEVEEGSIVRENTYEGLILRDETVINSEADGYLNYYIQSGKKVAVGTPVYSVDESGSLNEYLRTHADELQSFSDADISSIHKSLSDYTKQSSDVTFSKLYSLSDKLSAMVSEYKNISILSSMSDELRNAGISLSDHYANQTGLVSYVVDGYEDITLEGIDESLFDKSSYQRSMINNGELTASGEPAYKLITSDKWQIVFRLNDSDIAYYSDRSSLRIDLIDSGITTNAAFETIIGEDGNSYGVLSLSGYLNYYYEDRFIDFEIIESNVSGLKIPERSITEKDFYVIPSEFLTEDERGNVGFYKEVVTESGNASIFAITDIYNNDGEYCYIECTDTSEIKPGDVIVLRDDTESRYTVAQTKPLSGVYNINKGYTVFKRIEPLETANGYCIIAKNTSYGLSVYDHIVLDASTVGDGQVLYR